MSTDPLIHTLIHSLSIYVINRQIHNTPSYTPLTHSNTLVTPPFTFLSKPTFFSPPHQQISRESVFNAGAYGVRRIVLSLLSPSTAVAPNGSINGSINGSRPPSGSVNGPLQGDEVVIFDRKFDVYPTRGWDVWTKSKTRNANNIDVEPSKSKQRQPQQQPQQQQQQQQQLQQPPRDNNAIAGQTNPRGSGSSYYTLPAMPTMFGGKQQPPQQVQSFRHTHTHPHTHTRTHSPLCIWTHRSLHTPLSERPYAHAHTYRINIRSDALSHTPCNTIEF